jgi:protocatechuate 3,4-dioxygenase beta subunit
MKLLFGIEHPIILITLFLTFSARQIPENSYPEQNCINLESGQKGFIQLAKREEPGEPLVIYGRVIDRNTNQPIQDASLFLYQTDSSGIYNAAGGPDVQARIRGTLQTNESGCFKIKTILPGDYPGQKNSRHLHYIINANGYKELKSLLFFKGFTTENITSEGPLAVVDIKKEKNGTWVGSIDVSIERSNSSIR